MPDRRNNQLDRRATPALDAALLERFLDCGVRAVDLMVTTECSFRCIYCYQTRGLRREMATDVLDAAIRRLVTSRFDTPRLMFLGGEPLLSPQLVKRALDRVRTWAPRRMKPDIRITTNGSLLDEKMTRLLVSRDVHITLSFDGVARAQVDRAPGSFARLDRLLLRLRRNHPGHFSLRLAVMATLTSRNVLHLADSVRYFLARGVRDLDVVPVVTHDPGWNARSRDELDRQLAEVVQASIEEHAVSGEVPYRSFRNGLTRHRLPKGRSLVCGAARKGFLFVDVDGTISPCAAMAGSCLPRPPELLGKVMTALGGCHVGDPDLAKKLEARERKAARLPLLTVRPASRAESGCAECELRGSCQICPASIGFEREATGTERNPAIQCDFNRLIQKHRTAFHRSIQERAGAADSGGPRIVGRNPVSTAKTAAF